MRCLIHPARDCPLADRCEIEGCLQPSGYAPQALIPERAPIDLPYQPSRLTRRWMALVDRGTAMVRRGPAPFAPALPPPEPPAMNPIAPEPQPQPAPAPTLPPPEVRILEVPGPAWVVYLGGTPIGLTTRIERPR